MTEKKTLVSRQIMIVLWLMFAAISAIEMLKQYGKGGFKNPYVYLLFAIFIFSWYMYFKGRKNRLGNS
ncbi:MAG: hypothetical protein JNM67_08070 [Bacteroidetes bacterium]|nr:hypothetical protein [Bacteroidota bacterium]